MEQSPTIIGGVFRFYGILYSLFLKFRSLNVGYTKDLLERLHQHNHIGYNTFTSKYRPWVLKAAFECGESESDAVRIERFINKQKSRI